MSDWLDAIEARLAAATPGPWVLDWPGQCCATYCVVAVAGADETSVAHNVTSKPADADFIANAPADIARLMKALRDATLAEEEGE